MLLTLHKELTKTSFIEYNIGLPIAELLSFIFSGKEMKFKMCQNITITPEKDQILKIIDEYHTSKAHIPRGIKETIRPFKNRFNWTGINKDIDFVKQCEIYQRVKICCKNLYQPLVVTKCPKNVFERIIIDILDILTKNYVPTNCDALTKFIQAYHIDYKLQKQS